MCDREQVGAAQVWRDLSLEHVDEDRLRSQRVAHRKRFLRVRDELAGQLNRPRYGQAVVWQGNSAKEPGMFGEGLDGRSQDATP